MFKTNYGEMVDFENQSVRFDDQEYSINDLMHLKNIYMQFTTAEYILENNEDYSEEECWEIAGITREKMDKYDMSEDEAIEEAINEYVPTKETVKNEESYESEWDFSQFTEELFNSNGKVSAVKAGITALHNIGKDWDDEDYEYFDDIPFSSKNNDMFIKYKDLYVVPRIFCNSDDENIELLFDVYILKKSILQIDNPKSLFQNCPYFDDDYIDHDAYNQFFVERINGKLVAVECIPISIETVEYLDNKDILNAENLFGTIKDIIKNNDPELIFNDFKAYFNASSSLEDKSNSQTRNGTGLTEYEFNRLVKAGDWNINIDGYYNVAKSLTNKAAGKPYQIKDGEQLGCVAFGNDFFSMNVYEDGGVPGQYVCEMIKHYPNDNVSADELKEFKFDTIFSTELYSKYVDRDDEVCASFVIDHSNLLPENTKKFKKDAVEMLVYVNAIDNEMVEGYRELKNLGKGFYNQLKEREFSLEILNTVREKWFPAGVAKKDKLSMEDFESLAAYYKKITPLVTEGKDTLFGDRLMVKVMINDGLSDMRIKSVAGAMVPGDDFSNRVSGLLQEANIKNFREETEYKRTHAVHSEKKR